MKQLASYADISDKNLLKIHANSEKKTGLLAYNSSQLTFMHIIYTLGMVTQMRRQSTHTSKISFNTCIWHIF